MLIWSHLWSLPLSKSSYRIFIWICFWISQIWCDLDLNLGLVYIGKDYPAIMFEILGCCNDIFSLEFWLQEWNWHSCQPRSQLSHISNIVHPQSLFYSVLMIGVKVKLFELTHKEILYQIPISSNEPMKEVILCQPK